MNAGETGGAAGEAGIHARLAAWRQAHPHATFDEIEDAVQQEIARYQAQLVDEVIQAGRAGGPVAAEPGASERSAGERPVCATCGERMRPCGRRRREVLCRLGQPVELNRDYYVCPACGAGLFPPR
jgi:hypothetical protein